MNRIPIYVCAALALTLSGCGDTDGDSATTEPAVTATDDATTTSPAPTPAPTPEHSLRTEEISEGAAHTAVGPMGTGDAADQETDDPRGDE